MNKSDGICNRHEAVRGSRIERAVAVEAIFKKRYPAFTVIERRIKETY